jgi:hypothetical protein
VRHTRQTIGRLFRCLSGLSERVYSTHCETIAQEESKITILRKYEQPWVNSYGYLLAWDPQVQNLVPQVGTSQKYTSQHVSDLG